MDMQPNSPTGQYISQTDHSGTFGLEGTHDNRNDFHGELFENLKKNYEQRIQELELHIKETYHLVENDEIIQTMQMNHVSENFRQQRIQEIIEDSLGGEREAQIEKLNYSNALLKTELERIDQENQKIVQMYNQEVAKFNKTISDFKNALQTEVQAKNQFQQECEKLTNKLAIVAQQHEEIVKQRGGADSKLQNEINRLVQENQSLKKQRDEQERTNKQKDELIEEMRKDMEILKNEYIELENANHCLNADQNEYADILAAFKEKKSQDEGEIKKLRETVRRMEDDSKDAKQELDRTLQENSELIAKSEYISSQVKKLVESGQKNTSEMIEEVKQKYKAKIEELKRKLEETTSANEGLKNEVFNLSSEFEVTRLNSEKLVAQFQNDLKLVKNEWHKKCQEIEFRGQKELTEAQAKHQETINKLQMEYQQLIQKKVKDAQNESREEITQIRVIEKETRAQLEAKVARFERDYMLKATHESTLAAEVLDLKTNHLQDLKELEDKFERDYTAKLREITEKSRIEFENNLASLKSQNKLLEQQLSTIKGDSQQVLETAIKEKEKSQKLEIELKEVRLTENRLMEDLEESREHLNRIKNLYDDEVRKGKKKELELEDFLHKTDLARQKEGEFSEILNASRDEISELKDLLVVQNQRLSRAINQEKASTEEIGILKISLETSEKEKKSLHEKIAELEYDLTLAKEKESENQMFGTGKLQESLTQAEGKVKTLIKELTMKEESVNLLNRNIKELKEMLERNQERVEELETEREKHRGAYKELLRKSELGDMENKKKVHEAIRVVSRELNSMKQQVNRLKNGCKVEIEHSNDIMKELVLDFQNEVQTKISHWISSATSQQRKIREEEIAKEEYERNKEEIQSLQYETREWRTKSEEAAKKIMEYEKIIKKLEEGENKMREESNRKVEEFRNFQEFVQTELTRIKEESENGVKQLVWRHKQDIHRIMLNLEELKGKRLERMMKIEDEIVKMQRESERNAEEMEAWYEKKIRDYEKNSIEAAEELTELRKEIVNLEEMNDKLKEDNKNMMDTLEEKLSVVREIMTRDKEKQNNEKLKENTEIDRLRHTVRDLMIENATKEDKIKELTKSAETHRETHREEKNKTLSSDRDWEVIEVKRNREREMEELQNLLAKTMNEVGRKSSRLEGKPERDTQDTGRRKSSAMKGAGYERLSEKINPDDH